MSGERITLADIPKPADDELLVVVGPTASGKTELAIQLAERFGGEVVSADSVQVYRGFDLGSGKPTAAERRRAPHHLVDVREPGDPLDAQQFAALADAAIADVRARGKVPVVCGGTYLWVRALVHGLAPAPPADAEVRARHAEIAKAEGRAALHAKLAAVDPESAARLAPNDLLRVSRALEIWETSGKPQSAWFAEHGFRAERHKARLIGVHRERDELDQRIAARTARWLAEGWVDEVRGLVERGFGGSRAMGSVGYRQVKEHLDGEDRRRRPGGRRGAGDAGVRAAAADVAAGRGGGVGGPPDGRRRREREEKRRQGWGLFDRGRSSRCRAAAWRGHLSRAGAEICTQCATHRAPPRALAEAERRRRPASRASFAVKPPPPPLFSFSSSPSPSRRSQQRHRIHVHHHPDVPVHPLDHLPQIREHRPQRGPVRRPQHHPEPEPPP